MERKWVKTLGFTVLVLAFLPCCGRGAVETKGNQIQGKKTTLLGLVEIFGQGIYTTAELG